MNEIELTIPLFHMILFVVMISLCLLFSRYKLGLSITFCFTFYWGYILNREVFIEIEGLTPFFFFYLFSGFLIIVCAIVSFFAEE